MQCGLAVDVWYTAGRNHAGVHGWVVAWLQQDGWRICVARGGKERVISWRERPFFDFDFDFDCDIDQRRARAGLG